MDQQRILYRGGRVLNVGTDIADTSTLRAFNMKANQLLLAAILASAIGAPIETLPADKSVGPRILPQRFNYPLKASCLRLAVRPGGSIHRH
jgi:hypothetical protein